MANYKGNLLVVQSNHLGNVINKRLTVNQQKMVAIYIAKLNPKDPTTRRVTLSLDEYAKHMNLSRYNITKLKKESIDLVRLPVCIDQPDGGFITVPTFSKFKLYQNDDGKWFVDIDCSEDILPYLFKLQREFYKYELWNILRLREKNHQQLYRLLKMYEKMGERIITLSELKLYLGLDDTKYQFNEFNRRVLKGCQVALQEHTDIQFTYKTIRKGRSVHAIKFDIFKNLDYVDQLTLDEYLFEIEESICIENLQPIEITNENLAFLAEACNNEFSESEMQLLFDLVGQIIPFSAKGQNADLQRYDYLHRQYNNLNYNAEKRDISNRFGYLKKMIEGELKENE